MQYDYAYMGIKLISDACTWAAEPGGTGGHVIPQILFVLHTEMLL